MILERHPDGVTLLSNGARRSTILDSLGELFDFEVVDERGSDPSLRARAGSDPPVRAHARSDPPVRAHAVGLSLEDALSLALGDTPYIVESRVDPFDGHRVLARVIVSPEAADEALPPSQGEKPAMGIERASLLRELIDASAEERAASIWMIDPDDPDELDFLLHLLSDDADPRVRAAAATQLQLAEATRAILALEAAKGDPDPSTADAAIEALERILSRPSAVTTE